MNTRRAAILLFCAVVAACGERSVPTSPAPAAQGLGASAEPTPPPGPYTLGFGELRENRAAVTTYTESGFTMSFASAAWTAVTTYGVPAPSVQFNSAGGVTTVGELKITAGGATFQFLSADLYSSTTPIPYTITGQSATGTVTVASGTVGNTFGRFAGIRSSTPEALFESVTIRLTNPAAPCCVNPVGIDNISLKR